MAGGSQRRYVKKAHHGKHSGATRASAKVRLARQAAHTTSRGKQMYAQVNSRTAGFLGIEKKFYDTGLSASALTAAADFAGCERDPSSTSMISTPAQGDGPSNREGKRILMRSVQVKGAVTVDPLADRTGGLQSSIVYIALVLDTQTNGAQLNAEDVFVNPSANLDAVGTPMRNLLYGSRFRILKSETLELPINNATYDGTNIETFGVSRTFDWFVPLGEGIPVNFNAGTTSSIANVIDNSLHIIAVTSSIGDLSYNARIRFVG